MDLIAPVSIQTSPEGIQQAVARQGYAVVSAQSVQAAMPMPGLAELAAFWNNLPADAYLRDGGRYRSRRHGSHVITRAAGSCDVQAVPHRAHWQPLDYNALHGGIERWFAPLEPALAEHPVYVGVLDTLAKWASLCKPEVTTWFAETHLFRIDTHGGIGRPTPEGAHRDGVDFVAVFLVDRHQIKGGETRVFESQGSRGERFTLVEPWSLLWLDDVRVVHETTPIQPLEAGALGWRDTLVITLRQGAFQDPL